MGVYQRHDYADEKRAALNAWATHLSALLEGRKPGAAISIVSALKKPDGTLEANRVNVGRGGVVPN